MIGRTGVFAPYSALEARLCLEEGVSDATPVDGYFQGISSESGVKLSINEAYSTEFDDMYFPITSFEQSPLQLTAARGDQQYDDGADLQRGRDKRERRGSLQRRALYDSRT